MSAPVWLKKARRRVQRLKGNVRRQVENKRCDICGHRALWNESWTGEPSGRRVWHNYCRSYQMWRTKADERLAVLDLITDVWGIDMNDVTGVAEMRAVDDLLDRSRQRDRAWRVMYDLDNERAKAAKQARVTASSERSSDS